MLREASVLALALCLMCQVTVCFPTRSLLHRRLESAQNNLQLLNMRELMNRRSQTRTQDYKQQLSDALKKLKDTTNISPSSLAEFRHFLNSEPGTGKILRHPQMFRKFLSKIDLSGVSDLAFLLNSKQ